MAKKKQDVARGGTPAGYGFLTVTGLLVLAFTAVIAARRDLPGSARALDGTAFGAGGAVSEAPGGPAPTVVDSVFPNEEEIRRFRVGLTEVTKLTGGAGSRDELVERFVRAIERADTAALVPLLLDRAEFAWLYYPHTMYTTRPYQLSPALLWFQMQNLTGSGLARVFRRAAEGTLHVSGYRCEETPKAEGPNRVWSECKVILHPAGGEPSEMQLFGSILERGGVHKFVSYASHL